MIDNPNTTVFPPSRKLEIVASTVAVTGGTGFIGGELVKRLVSEGHLVRVLTRRANGAMSRPAGIELFQGDLVNNPGILDKFLDGVDTLYHCAAEINNSNIMLAANATGTRNLVCAAQGKIRHWVQLSTVDVYGTHANGIITEETPIAPVNIYEESKAAADAVVVEAANKSDFAYSILRPSKVYGPRMRNQVLYQLASLVDRGLFFFIGKPGASANYIHVDDVVEGLLKCGSMLSARNRIYNLSDYRTIEDFIGIISMALDKTVPKWRISEDLARIAAKITSFIPGNPLKEQRVNAMVKRAKYSTLRIEDELNFHLGVPMEIGIRQLAIDWTKNRRQQI